MTERIEHKGPEMANVLSCLVQETLHLPGSMRILILSLTCRPFEHIVFEKSSL